MIFAGLNPLWRATPLAVAIGVLALVASAALAQPVAERPATSVTGLVVTGKRAPEKPESFPTKVSKFVVARAHVSPIGTLARWADPICPATVGINPAFGKVVVNRIVQVAARVGAPTAKQCLKPNVMVAFTTVPQELMEDVRKNHTVLLGFHYPPEEKALAAFHGPMEAWHVSGTRWAWDDTRTLDDVSANAKNSTLGENPFPSVAVPDQSRITIEELDEFEVALVVVDANAIDGRAIGAIADHIALLVLSDVRPSNACSPLPSLLDAWNPACPDSASLETLSPYDEAFLKGLYAGNPREVLQEERGSVMQQIKRDTRPPLPPVDEK